MSQISGNGAAFYVGGATNPIYTTMTTQQRTYISQNPNPQRFNNNSSYNASHQNLNIGYASSFYSRNVGKPGYNHFVQERRQLFCDHYKVNGHTIQKCYKIHGYPPGHKYYRGKRVAAATQTDTINYNPVQEDSSTTIPSLTPQQYDQLMQLLNKQNNRCRDHK